MGGEDSAQTKLDRYLSNMCPECGMVFETAKGLKIHLTKHVRDDSDTISTIITHWNLFSESERQAVFKAITAKTVDEAVQILSSTRSRCLQRVAESARRRPELFKEIVDIIAESGGVGDEEIDYIG